MNRLELLKALQAIDMRSDENRRATRETELRLADESVLVAASKELDAGRHLLTDLRAQFRNLELEADGLAARIRQINDRLYGGRVSNPKELNGLQQEEAMLRRQKAELEDRMLELMVDIESAEANVRARSEGLGRLSAERATSVARDREQLAELARASERQSAQRAQLRAQIALTDLAVYDDLALAKRGQAVAILKGASCSACGFQVPSGLASRVKMGELVFCANCGRILVP